jgi:hypothetical protein
MIAFKRPQLEDRAWIDPIFRTSGLRSCEYTFTNLFTWAEAYDETVAIVDGFLIIRVGAEGGCYNWGAGSGDRKKLMYSLYEDAVERGCRFQVVGLTAEQIEELEELFPGKFEVENYRDGADYCYKVDRLADLTGKKLHAKRNHIHRFEDNFPEWRVEEINQENMHLCLALAQDWEETEREIGGDDWTEQEGEIALRMSAQYYEELGLEGLILYGEDKPLAFTMGKSIGGDTYDVFFEKAYADVQGAYPMINREFARWVREHHPEIVYLNREDDLGEPGLRKAKLSYYPDLMVEKHIATLKEGETL